MTITKNILYSAPVLVITRPTCASRCPWNRPIKAPTYLTAAWDINRGRLVNLHFSDAGTGTDAIIQAVTRMLGSRGLSRKAYVKHCLAEMETTCEVCASPDNRTWLKPLRSLNHKCSCEQSQVERAMHRPRQNGRVTKALASSYLTFPSDTASAKQSKLERQSKAIQDMIMDRFNEPLLRNSIEWKIIVCEWVRYGVAAHNCDHPHHQRILIPSRKTLYRVIDQLASDLDRLDETLLSDK